MFFIHFSKTAVTIEDLCSRNSTRLVEIETEHCHLIYNFWTILLDDWTIKHVCWLNCVRKKKLFSSTYLPRFTPISPPSLTRETWKTGVHTVCKSAEIYAYFILNSSLPMNPLKSWIDFPYSSVAGDILLIKYLMSLWLDNDLCANTNTKTECTLFVNDRTNSLGTLDTWI